MKAENLKTRSDLTGDLSHATETMAVRHSVASEGNVHVQGEAGLVLETISWGGAGLFTHSLRLRPRGIYLDKKCWIL